MKLEARNLAWSARRIPIVSGVSFTVQPGQILGLIGPNGSGKSTIMRMLAGLALPKAGEVLINGTPLSTLNRRSIAQTIAFVEQQADTSDRITVRDAVELGRTPWLPPLAPWSDRDTAVVEQALSDVGLSQMADRYWHTLSGGERQRVHIGRALAQEAGILLLDEPTNHLDVSHQISILQLVAKLKITKVIALHDLNQAFKCDRLGVMHKGQMVAFGKPEELLTPEFLREIFNVCAHALTDPADGATVLRFHSFSGRDHQA